MAKKAQEKLFFMVTSEIIYPSLLLLYRGWGGTKVKNNYQTKW